jgi:regulator of cell morphogenesis and NO signaling
MRPVHLTIRSLLALVLLVALSSCSKPRSEESRTGQGVSPAERGASSGPGGVAQAEALRTRTVADIVTRFPVTARVLQSYRIDFCCKGNVTLAQALQGREERVEEVLAELEAAIRAPGAGGEGPSTDLTSPALIGRIIDRHHTYLRRTLPALGPLLEKVAAVHGDHNPKLRPLHRAFAGLRDRILPHLDGEEQALFPLLMTRTAEKARVEGELRAMRDDHVVVGAALAGIRDLSDGFSVPEWGCNSYRIAMAELHGLETDVLRHVHLENHVLMPRFAANLASPAPHGPEHPGSAPGDAR